MEAENYLAGGRALRQSLEAHGSGWPRLGDVARIWQPSRLKGIQVSSEFGTPFLAATQVFDQRPVPRKWLSLHRTENANERFVEEGTILVSCSGTVGRATLAHRPHQRMLISHDLLRVEPKDTKWWGWVYAFLRSQSAVQMMNASRYGHIIKHLETAHLDTIPIPRVSDKLLETFNQNAHEILSLRNRAHELTILAEARFARDIGVPSTGDNGETGFVVRASECLFRGRRRFDAYPHRPEVRALERHLARESNGLTTLPEAGYEVWLPNRFKRTPAVEGVQMVDSSQLFEINPDTSRTIADSGFGDPYNGRVKPGWLLLARSGQIYGINGSITMATAAYQGKVISDDAIRIAPPLNPSIEPGYIYVALSHPELGRPVVKALAYGSSIPHIDTSDVLTLRIPRLREDSEEEIARLAQESFGHRGQADILETATAVAADQIIGRVLHGDVRDLSSP